MRQENDSDALCFVVLSVAGPAIQPRSGHSLPGMREFRTFQTRLV